eukprot:TRINITY_DN1990_c0_g1_i2.p2 TRINITY_DN1990_c0_g1~~TRINITY_DN1990_c0_g1_i2.p2  ORF type:complete len:141 (-),score=45.58 TRINITY_DN1990_c0_g1_i2:238-660(-)
MVPPVLAWTARVALSIVLYAGSGAVWYSPSVAGTVFLAAAHPDLAKAGTPLPPPDPRAYPAALMGASIAMPLYVFLLHVVGALHSVGAAVGWAVGVALFAAGLTAPHGWFEGRDPRLFWVHAGYHAAGLVAVAVVLAVLP